EVLVEENLAASAEGIVVPGKISLRELYNDYDIKIPLNANYSTLTGFLLEMLGNNFPKQSNVVYWEGLSFELTKVKNSEILEVTIKDVSGEHFLKRSDEDERKEQAPNE